MCGFLLQGRVRASRAGYGFLGRTKIEERSRTTGLKEMYRRLLGSGFRV